jgi:hypothetical protein
MPFIEVTTGDAAVRALVDEDHWHELIQYSWRRNVGGYALTGDSQLMHRLIMKATGWTTGHQICGLQRAVKTGKIKSSEAEPLHSTSVRHLSSRSRWITCLGVKYPLETHPSEIDATRAHNVKAVELFGVHAKINKLTEDTG